MTPEERSAAREAAERLHDADLKAAHSQALEKHRDLGARARATKDRNKAMAIEADAREVWAHAQMLNAVKTERARHYAKRYKQRAAAVGAGMVEPLAVLDVVADLGPTTRANVRSAFAKMVEAHLEANPEPYDGFGLGYVHGLVEDAIDHRVTKAVAECLAEGDLKRTKGRHMREELGVVLGRVNANEWCLYTERQLDEAKGAAARAVERREREEAAWLALADKVADLDITREGNGRVSMSIATLSRILDLATKEPTP